MYAIIDSGNKQFKVSKGDVIEIELLPETEEILFDKVLLVADGDNVSVGTPYLTKAKVAGKVLNVFKDTKVINFKYKHKVNYHRKKGHRQNLMKVQIEEVSL